MTKKLFSMLAMVFVVGLMFWATPALAQTIETSSDAWTTAFNKVTEVFQYSRKMIFIIGGFGLIVLAFFAIFGRIQWKWFAALCVGLGIVAIAGMVIDYVTVTGTGTSGTSPINTRGTLGDSMGVGASTGTAKK